jgi:hypothetical protein
VINECSFAVQLMLLKYRSMQLCKIIYNVFVKVMWIWIKRFTAWNVQGENAFLSIWWTFSWLPLPHPWYHSSKYWLYFYSDIKKTWVLYFAQAFCLCVICKGLRNLCWRDSTDIIIVICQPTSVHTDLNMNYQSYSSQIQTNMT